MCSALFSFYSQCPGLPICPYGYIIIAACGQRLMPSAYPSVSSSFSSKLLLSVPLFWPSQSQLSPFVFLPRSLLEYQSSNNSQADISSQFLAQMGTSYLIPSLSSMTLPNLHLFQSKQSPLMTLTCELFSKFLGSTSSFFPPKSQFITFSIAVFLSSPSFLPYSLHLFHHLHASLLFIIQLTHFPFPIPPSSQAKLQHYRDKISQIFLKE